MATHLNILIQQHHPRWRGYAATARKAAFVALSSQKKTSVGLTILLTDDKEIRDLNHQYRGKDKPTNVLSFPDGEADETGRIHLGDLALAYETMAAEAKGQGKSLRAHLSHLVIHGVLHLLGYDHERARDAARMETLEIKLLSGLGIENPYESH